MSLKDKFDSLVKKASSIINEVYDWLGKLRWKNRIILYSVLGIVVIAISHYVFSYFGFLHTDIDSARYMLSALVQGEAAIVALVVTLSLVAVQLAAQSYSARVIEVFRKAPDLWILMVIYGIAIFYGLGVLKLINNDNISDLEIYISGAYYFGIFAFVALVPYMLKMFDMLKSSTVINMLAEKITKQNVLDGITEWDERPNEKDPIQPIIDIIRSSLMKFDDEIIKYGLITIVYRTNLILEKGNFSKNEAEKILLHIFVNLTMVGKLAASKEYDSAIFQVITSLRNIGLITTKIKLKNSTLEVINRIKILGVEAAYHNLNFTARYAKTSLNVFKMEIQKYDLEEVVPFISDYIDEMNIAMEKSKK